MEVGKLNSELAVPSQLDDAGSEISFPRIIPFGCGKSNLHYVCT